VPTTIVVAEALQKGGIILLFNLDHLIQSQGSDPGSEVLPKEKLGRVVG